MNLALQELPVRREKESLSLSGLQLAFGFVRVPDNVLSNLRQLLRVTQARPLHCHELSLLSSEANPQKSSLNKKQHRLLLFYVAVTVSILSPFHSQTCRNPWETNLKLGPDVLQAFFSPSFSTMQPISQNYKCYNV